MTKKKSLVEIARSQPVHHRHTHGTSKEEIDLAVAYFTGVVTAKQIVDAGYSPTSGSAKNAMATILRNACMAKRVIVRIP